MSTSARTASGAFIQQATHDTKKSEYQPAKTGHVARGVVNIYISCMLCEEGVAGLRRHALVDVLARGRDAWAAGSPERSGRRGRRRGGQGRSAGVVGGEGLATGLARMDRVTFSTLKPTFSVVSE